jgi:hypothetical protein
MARFEGDFESLSQERRANPALKETYKFHWDNHASHRPISDDQYLHCPPRVLGYALKLKKWAQFRLRLEGAIKPVFADETVFENMLQLDQECKELLKWSVQAHEEGKKINAQGERKGLEDFAPDKGRGLFIILYG